MVYDIDNEILYRLMCLLTCATFVDEVRVIYFIRKNMLFICDYGEVKKQ